MYLRKTWIVGAMAAAALAGGATGAAAEDERRYDFADFDRIDISAGIALVAEIGPSQSVVVKTDNGDFEDLEIDVSGGELSVSREWNRLRWHSKKSNYKVYVTAPSLRSLEASSGSNAKVSNISAERFVVDLSSGSYAKLDGRCVDCLADLSSGANLDARGLECEIVTIDVSSGGKGEISAVRSVVADASSGGFAAVYGSPEKVSIDKSSGGRVKIVSGARAERD